MPLPPTINSNLLAQSLSSEKAPLIKVGQTLNLSIISISKNIATINIGGQTLQANLGSALPENKVFQATVTQLTPELKLVIKGEARPTSDNITHKMLANLLPNQSASKPQIQQLIQLQNSPQLPAAIQAQLTSLIDSIFKLSPQINALQIRQAMLNSGLFLESKLSKKQGGIKQDFKAQLFQLKNAIDTTALKQPSPELKQAQTSINSLLNKTQIQQIQALDGQNMTFDLPVTSQHTLHEMTVDIRHKKLKDTDIWEILTELKFEDESLVVKSALINENLTFQIWAEPHYFMIQVKNSLDMFKKQLDGSNIAYTGIYIATAPPKVDTQAKKIALIDIKV